MTGFRFRLPSHWLGRHGLPAAILAACLLGIVSQVQARSPVEAGSFTRGDGLQVTAFELDHGITKYRRTTCGFEMPDGSTLDVSLTGKTDVDQKNPQSRRYQACLIRTLDTSAEIYLYPSTRLPVAASVQRFDGYQFTDITTAEKRWLSPLIHIGRHWLGYLMCLVLTLPFLILETMIVRRTCGRGWWRTLRRITIGAGIGFVSFYILVTTLSGPYSPLIYILIAGAGLLMYRGMYKALRI